MAIKSIKDRINNLIIVSVGIFIAGVIEGILSVVAKDANLNSLFVISMFGFIITAMLIVFYYMRLSSKRYNLKNKICTDYQKVKIDFDYNKKLPQVLINTDFKETFAKVAGLDGCDIIIKGIYHNKREREIYLARNDVEFLEVEES